LAAAASSTSFPVAVVNEGPPPLSAPEVEWNIERSDLSSYISAAAAINRSNVDAISVQHEFGIYGGLDGAYLIDFLDHLRAPVVTTCHTVLAHPSESQRYVLQQITGRSARVVVMAEKGRDLLISSNGIPHEKIEVIPHGIPDAQVTPVQRQSTRARLAWEGRQVILSFGLLSPNKGLEQAIRSLPQIVRANPKALYVITGATHPNLVRDEGERYRENLERLTRELGMANHVEFINRFVTRDELLELIAAADLYLTPYLNEEQITSGTLAYAFGLGKPVVSTPYWHAADLLSNGAGVLVPFDDPAAIAAAVTGLLSNPGRMRRMGGRAREKGLSMRWRQIGMRYLSLFREITLSHTQPRYATTAVASPVRPIRTVAGPVGVPTNQGRRGCSLQRPGRDSRLPRQAAGVLRSERYRAHRVEHRCV
jgi:glycosyltransferase involved in cell wall biosynthesis